MSARGPDGACAKCNSTNTRLATECSDHPGVVRCLDCGEVTFGGGKREPAFTPRAVTPIGQRETEAFVTRRDGPCGLETLTLSVYPPEPRGSLLREARTGVLRNAPRRSVYFDHEAGKLVVEGPAFDERDERGYLSLGDAARLAGVSVVEFSGLEMGRYTLDDEGWVRLLALVDGARRAKGADADGPRDP